ncbi:MAG: hypothetical protein KA052_03320 [Candidatus Pacebacteria bacterium]|nr:hypothetical protein [Candidatus Paceibacterota bacterium]
MNTKKIILGLFLMLGVVGLGLYGGSRVSANNNDMKRMHDFGEQFKKAHENGSTLEVHISDKGAVLVRGAKVTAINGAVISATTAWNNSNISWMVATDANTKFSNRLGGANNLSGIAVGNVISFSGSLASSASGTMGVSASHVKDWTKQVPVNVKTTVEGKVKSAPLSANAPTTLILTVDDRDYTVRIASDTSVLNSLWLRTAISNIRVGDKVRVYGMVNSDFTIDATVLRDTNLR